MCIEYCVYANMIHLRAEGVDERILMCLINKNKEQTNKQKIKKIVRTHDSE